MWLTCIIHPDFRLIELNTSYLWFTENLVIDDSYCITQNTRINWVLFCLPLWLMFMRHRSRNFQWIINMTYLVLWDENRVELCMWVTNMTHLKMLWNQNLQIVIFYFLRRRSRQISKILVWLTCKSNFWSNDMYIMHILALESVISQMF